MPSFVLPAWLIAAGGITLLSLLTLQLLVGYRKIRFKGAVHMKVHRFVAWTMLTLAVLHGFGGLLILGVIRIGG